MTHVRRVAAVALALAATALTTTVHQPAQAAVAKHRPATTVRLHFTGCDRCSVTLQQAITGKDHVWTSKSRRIGSDHKVTFKVLRSHTHGMSFVLDAPWERDTGAVSNVVTRYRGHSVDSFVRRTGARHGKHAEGCWAGTSLDSVRLSFNVARVPAKSLTGQPTHIPLAYATHTMSSWKPMVKTYKGTIGNQDAFWCTRPPTTKLTLTAAHCHGCQIGVMNGALRPENVWTAPIKTVKRGKVTVRVPRPLTRGISTTVYAPWEGATGYTTVVAWKYAGHRVGSDVSFSDARAAHRGSPCWGGTHKSDLTVALTVRKVRVEGTTGPTNGTIAFARVTQDWLRPMERTDHGILGSQEVITCAK